MIYNKIPLRSEGDFFAINKKMALRFQSAICVRLFSHDLAQLVCEFNRVLDRHTLDKKSL